MDALAMTARWVAAARERETLRPDRLFDDPLAGALAGDEGRAMFARFDHAAKAQGAPENPFLAIRTRWLDDLLLEACRGGLAQVAILAAGMDARAFRLDWPAGTRVFEVEREDVLACKAGILDKLGVTPRAERFAVAVDLRDDFGGALAAAGFSASQPAVFLVEGLLPYLPDGATAMNLVQRIAALAAPGSLLACDMVGKTFLESPWTRPYLDMLAAAGVAWRFGDDDPEGFFARAGFREVDVKQPGEINAARWPRPVVPRAVPHVPRAFFVTARY